MAAAATLLDPLPLALPRATLDLALCSAFA